MKRVLLRSNAFIRAARRFTRKHPDYADDLQAALELLTEDPFHPQLKTHKLKGKLEGSWACNTGYDLRVIFKFVEFEGAEAILLE
ncbi:MAG: type II toxin-antitoxin system mRNA interferase toxin, RelE/StbE family, partial [Deltaproteobacteria bacterium]|nr:type II toxin-antitoxin system mRNA interferase toxin, RelE/StbE family [Deltaproteobacteria bacterium]